MKISSLIHLRMLITLLFLANHISISAQKKMSNDTIIYPDMRIKTEVFVLNTCEPTEVSLRRTHDDDRLVYDRKMRTRKLQTYSNRLSSFKIEGINPLRYNFYINNTIVSQFMDSDPFNLTGNTFANKALIIPEIRYIEIFKTKFEGNPQIDVLKNLRKQIEAMNTSFEAKNNELNTAGKDLYPKPGKKATTKERTDYAEKEKKYDALRIETKKLADSVGTKVAEYESISNSLAINYPDFALINRWEKIESLYNEESCLRPITSMTKNFISHYKSMSRDFDLIGKYLSNPNAYMENRMRRGSTDTISPTTVINALNRNGYLSDVYFIQDYDNRSSSEREYTRVYNDNLFYTGTVRIKDFIVTQKIQAYQEIVLSLSAEIGKLLQNKVIDYSIELNNLENRKCIDTLDIDKAKEFQTSLKRIFRFIQEMSADTYVLISFLDIDVNKYKDIIDNINKRYTELLLFMKYLAHLEKHNTIEFTLPTSTNLKNVDLIRYEVKREDKLTGGSQSYLYDFWIRGGLKVDFSIGIFASGLTDNIYEKFQDGANVHIKRKEKGEYSFGFGGMVNITPRLGANWLNGGLSFGVIYSTNQRLQFLGSGAIHLGKTERIILHGGVAFGTIDVLDESSGNFVTVKKKKEFLFPGVASDFTIATIEKFTVRPFFGISYNLSKKNALQAVSGNGLDKYNSSMPADPKTKTISQ